MHLERHSTRRNSTTPLHNAQAHMAQSAHQVLQGEATSQVRSDSTHRASSTVSTMGLRMCLGPPHLGSSGRKCGRPGTKGMLEAAPVLSNTPTHTHSHMRPPPWQTAIRTCTQRVGSAATETAVCETNLAGSGGIQRFAKEPDPLGANAVYCSPCKVDLLPRKQLHRKKQLDGSSDTHTVKDSCCLRGA